MKTTNPGTILTIPRSSGSIDYYSGPSSATINPSFNSFLPTDLSHIKPDDKNASRTLHVRNLDRRITADLLKEKFGKYHDVIDVEIKNPESPSPYAFIQFPDVMSVIDTIHQYYKNENDRNKYRYKLNWGKTKTSSKLWLGKLPENITKEYIRTKIRSGLILDDITDIILDSQKCEAIVMFKHKDPAMKILEQIKSKQM
uniref:RRM domain-containing protein n=1 Tax=Panagrolaimus sp. JU765 TaxID=591449 RepID=A0AC34RGL2_9BILA